MQKCENCQKMIDAQKLDLHFSYCSKNFIQCPQCPKKYDKNYLQQHIQEQHTTHKCQNCSQLFKKQYIDQHKSQCQMKPKFCIYCELEVPYKQFQQHFKVCQSRTTKCQLCNIDIAKKNYDAHYAYCISIPQQYRQYHNKPPSQAVNQKRQRLVQRIDNSEYNLHQNPKRKMKNQGSKAANIFQGPTKQPIRKRGRPPKEKNSNKDINQTIKQHKKEKIEDLITPKKTIKRQSKPQQKVQKQTPQSHNYHQQVNLISDDSK